MGVEPINDGIARRSPVLKTGTITGPHALPFVANHLSRSISECNRDPHNLTRLHATTHICVKRREVRHCALTARIQHLLSVYFFAKVAGAPVSSLP